MDTKTRRGFEDKFCLKSFPIYDLISFISECSRVEKLFTASNTNKIKFLSKNYRGNEVNAIIDANISKSFRHFPNQESISKKHFYSGRKQKTIKSK